MEPYKEMYLQLANATEDAIQILIAAQRAYEARYLDAPPTPPIQILHPPVQQEDNVSE